MYKFKGSPPRLKMEAEGVTLFICTRCKVYRPKSEFRADRRSKAGCSSHCKKCIKKYKARHSRVGLPYYLDDDPPEPL